MDYKQNLQEALDKNELRKFLEGAYPYNIENSQYIPGTEPTNISAILSKAIYKLYAENPHIKSIFENTLMEMLDGNAFDIYTVILYIMSELFKEKNDIAPFQLNIRKLLLKLQNILPNVREELRNGVSNGEDYSNINAWNDIQRYNRLCKDEYGFQLF